MTGELPRKALSGTPPPGKRIIERTRDAIEEAAAAGYFSNLPGSGQPLDFSFEENPYIPDDSRSAFRILKNAGFALPWMEDRKDIDKKRDDIHRRLELHLRRVESMVRNIGRMPAYLRPSRRSRLQEEHADFLSRFGRSVDGLNVKIDIYNLSVPSVTLQIPRFDPSSALERLGNALRSVEET